MAEKKTGFNLAEALAGVSKLDTGASGREQIEYIDIDRIDDDPNNFYELSGLGELAANIELCGLQQPIRVRTNPDDASRVIIVSGHRRRAAIRQLVADGRDDLREIPCIRERTDGSAALQELRLIYANSDTRKLTSAEISKQAERVEALLYQLKEEGYEFPGRMRDHVAEACKLSKTKLARLKVIRDGLSKSGQIKKAWEKGELSESTAYRLARMPAELQDEIAYAYTHRKSYYGHGLTYLSERVVEDIDAELKKLRKLPCDLGGKCMELAQGKHDHIIEQRLASSYSYIACGEKCCEDCTELATCKHVCPKLLATQDKMKSDKRAAQKAARQQQAEADRPAINEIIQLWDRFGKARAEAGKSVSDCYGAAGVKYGAPDEDEVMRLECGEAKYATNTKLPYGYSCYLDDIHRFTRVADLLGVSLDYLLGRTDNPNVTTGPAGDPPAEGRLPLGFTHGMNRPPKAGPYYCKFDCDGTTLRQLAWWDSALNAWLFKKNGTKINAKCLKWFPLPEDDEG